MVLCPEPGRSDTPSPILRSAGSSRSWRILHSLFILGRAGAALPCPSLYGGTYLTDYLSFFFFLSQTKQSACVPPSPSGCRCRRKEPGPSVPQAGGAGAGGGALCSGPQLGKRVWLCASDLQPSTGVRGSLSFPWLPLCCPRRGRGTAQRRCRHPAGWWHGRGRLSKVSWCQHVCTQPESCCSAAHLHPFVGCLLSILDFRLFFWLRAQLPVVPVPSGGLQ